MNNYAWLWHNNGPRYLKQNSHTKLAKLFNQIFDSRGQEMQVVKIAQEWSEYMVHYTAPIVRVKKNLCRFEKFSSHLWTNN